ncbi:MAG: hypothetical protein JWN79_1697 [Gemmatimonadetes bacterium]|jgi:hypothetical protein|nr:hypothetical protein [Gemmatimonadota bacterium]
MAKARQRSRLCHVPLFQPGTSPYIPGVHDFEIGYIMGLVVGEGSFTADRQQPYLQVKLHARDPFPLRFLEERLGGRVYGPYTHQGRHYFTWLLRGPSLREAIPMFRDHLPESWKREQFDRWLSRHYDFLVRELPAASDPITDTDR